MLAFVNLVVDRYHIGQNDAGVAFVRYSDQAVVIFHLHQYTDANTLKAAVSGVQRVRWSSDFTSKSWLNRASKSISKKIDYTARNDSHCTGTTGHLGKND